jgi:hypothetical protein
MAKARKTTRKAAAKRPAKRAKRATAKLKKGRTVAKVKAKSKRAKAPKQGVLAGAVQTVTDAFGLHNRLAGRNPSKTETLPALWKALDATPFAV